MPACVRLKDDKANPCNVATATLRHGYRYPRSPGRKNRVLRVPRIGMDPHKLIKIRNKVFSPEEEHQLSGANYPNHHIHLSRPKTSLHAKPLPSCGTGEAGSQDFARNKSLGHPASFCATRRIRKTNRCFVPVAICRSACFVITSVYAHAVCTRFYFLCSIPFVVCLTDVPSARAPDCGK